MYEDLPPLEEGDEERLEESFKTAVPHRFKNKRKSEFLKRKNSTPSSAPSSPLAKSDSWATMKTKHSSWISVAPSTEERVIEIPFLDRNQP